MSSISIEIKARCSDPSRIRRLLRSRRAIFRGLDRQIDTYFHVPSGRLKLREGKIENALIYYRRVDQRNSKQCDSTLHPCLKETRLKRILVESLGVLAVVDKRREIYFIENTKFHIDRVKRLGSFLEIEVFGGKGPAGIPVLRKQCEFYQKFLGVRAKDLVADSYSDQLLKLKRR